MTTSLIRHDQIQRKVEAVQLWPSDTRDLTSSAISITTPTMTIREGLPSRQRPADASAHRPHPGSPLQAPGWVGCAGPTAPTSSPNPHSAWLPLARSPLGGFRTPALTPDARPVLAGIRKPSPRRSFRRALPMLRSRRSAARRRPRKAPASPGKAGSRGSSVRQAREEPGYQVAREILEDPHRFRQGARGRMNEGQVEHRQCPAAKNFDEPSVAHQLRLHDRR